MNQFFADLGRAVLKEWKGRNFSPVEFPAIATRAMEKRPPAKHVDLGALAREFLLEDEQPGQTRSDFGQPELVVFDDPRFYIQVLFWLEGAMEIHQHEFSGAFHVMAGSSLHSEFAFEDVKPVSAHFRLGHLRLKQTELLETGRTVPIVSGATHIHSLFHLDTPSVSVVIRTHNDPGTGPQFTYLPPHVAVDPFAGDALTARRKELLDVLEKTGDADYAKLVREMIAGLDFERGFFILQSAMGHLQNLGAWDKVWSAFAKKHGALAKYVPPTLEEIAWRDNIVGLRGSVTDPEHRFFLALLLNVPRRRDVVSIVGQRFSGQAVETILRWAEELSEASSAGTWMLDAEFPIEVRVPREKQPEVFLAALRHFLKDGKAPGKFAGHAPSAADVRHFRDAFARSSLRALVS